MSRSWFRQASQRRSKTAVRRTLCLQLESLEAREVLSGDISPPNFYNGPISPLPTVSDQMGALAEAYELTAYLPWDGPKALQSAGVQFGSGQDATALQSKGSASGQAATAWSDIMQARGLLNQEVALYNQQPQLGWANPDTYNGGHGTAQEHQLASQAEQLLWDAYNTTSSLPADSGNNPTPVLQGHVEVDVPAQGPMNWLQAAQNALARIMDDLNRELAAFGDFMNQWGADFYDSALQAALTFGQSLDRRVDALGVYLTSNAADNEAAQFNAFGSWMTHNALDNQVQAAQGIVNDFQHLQENPADALAGATFNIATAAALGGAGGALDGALFTEGLEGAAAANSLQAKGADYLLSAERQQRYWDKLAQLQANGYSNGEKMAELAMRIFQLGEGRIPAAVSGFGKYNLSGNGIDRVFQGLLDPTDLAVTESKFNSAFTPGSDPTRLLGTGYGFVQMSDGWVNEVIQRMAQSQIAVAKEVAGLLQQFGVSVKYMNVMNANGQHFFYPI